MAMQSPDELRTNLAEYRSQQNQVEQLLLSEPHNEEYEEIYRSLTEVIDLTEDLLKESEGLAATSSSAGPSSLPSSAHSYCCAVLAACFALT